MTIEDDVRAASEKFYSALNRMLNGDAGPLGDIWSPQRDRDDNASDRRSRSRVGPG